jgi:hypothetical protein
MATAHYAGLMLMPVLGPCGEHANHWYASPMVALPLNRAGAPVTAGLVLIIGPEAADVRRVGPRANIEAVRGNLGWPPLPLDLKSSSNEEPVHCMAEHRAAAVGPI